MNLSLNDDNDIKFFNQLGEETQPQILMFLYYPFVKQYRRYFYFRDYTTRNVDNFPVFFTDKNPDFKDFMSLVLKNLEPENMT